MSTTVLPSHPSYEANIPLITLTPSATEELVQRFGWPRYRSRQILRWIYRRRIPDIEGMTDLSHDHRAKLQAIARIGRFTTFERLTSSDGTCKFLFPLEDGATVESVLIPGGRRLTLCVSTQIGCTLDCQFCLTGTMGLKRNLKAHEIVDQVLTVQDHLASGQRLTNVVLMGMGEPLANFDAVADAIGRLTNPTWGVGLAARRITLSTAGLASRLREAAALGITLAVSLNATTDEQRARLMPMANDLFPFPMLLRACRSLPLSHRRRLTFEYVLLESVNDSEADARRLITLLRGLRCKINLVPFNPFPGSAFRRPTDSQILMFQSTLRHAGLDVFVRKSRGRDVLGACGQLGTLSQQKASHLVSPVGARV